MKFLILVFALLGLYQNGSHPIHTDKANQITIQTPTVNSHIIITNAFKGDEDVEGFWLSWDGKKVLQCKTFEPPTGCTLVNGATLDDVAKVIKSFAVWESNR